MSSTALDDFGKLILRLALGILILLHGFAKLTGGIGPIESMVIARGMPAFLAWGVYVGEIIAPLLVIAGFYARLGGLLIAVNMLVAIALAHTAKLFAMGGMGGWALELQGMFLFGALAVVFLGAGAYSVGGRNGRWN